MKHQGISNSDEKQIIHVCIYNKISLVQPHYENLPVEIC